MTHAPGLPIMPMTHPSVLKNELALLDYHQEFVALHSVMHDQMDPVCGVRSFASECGARAQLYGVDYYEILNKCKKVH